MDVLEKLDDINFSSTYNDKLAGYKVIDKNVISKEIPGVYRWDSYLALENMEMAWFLVMGPDNTRKQLSSVWHKIHLYNQYFIEFSRKMAGLSFWRSW